MAQWPERFVYVCAASRGAAVNAAPLVQAGVGRIARVEFLRGSAARSADAAQADQPYLDMLRFLDLLATGNGIKIPRYDPHFGNVEDPDRWSNVLSEICRRAEAEHLAVVFNLAGGSKMMSIGGMFGCADAAARESAHLLHVDGDVRPWFLQPGGRERLPCAGELTLLQYLTAYGMVSPNAPQREKLRAFSRSHVQELAAFANFLFGNRSQIGILNAHDKAFLGNSKEFIGPKTISWFHKTAQSTRNALVPLAATLGIAFTNSEITVKDAFGFDMIFQGGWLEAVLFNEIDKKIGNKAGFELDISVLLRNHGSPLDDMELDVALMARSQLHIIEAKSGSEGNAAKWFQQVEPMRTRLAGPFSETIVFNARGDAATRKEYAKRTARSNIRLLADNTSSLIEELDRVMMKVIRAAEDALA